MLQQAEMYLYVFVHKDHGGAGSRQHGSFFSLSPADNYLQKADTVLFIFLKKSYFIFWPVSQGKPGP